MKCVFSMSVLCLLLVGLSWEVGAFSEVDLEKLKATKECNKCDLSGANLTEANLTGANLTKANRAWNIFCGTKMPDESFNDSGC